MDTLALLVTLFKVLQINTSFLRFISYKSIAVFSVTVQNNLMKENN